MRLRQLPDRVDRDQRCPAFRGDTDPCPDAGADPRADPDPDPDAYAQADTRADSDTATDADTDADTQPISDRHQRRDTDVDRLPGRHATAAEFTAACQFRHGIRTAHNRSDSLRSPDTNTRRPGGCDRSAGGNCGHRIERFAG
jgi:hypothetical protein